MTSREIIRSEELRRTSVNSHHPELALRYTTAALTAKQWQTLIRLPIECGILLAQLVTVDERALVSPRERLDTRSERYRYASCGTGLVRVSLVRVAWTLRCTYTRVPSIHKKE